MGKMDEKILVLGRNYLFEDDSLLFQGVQTNKKIVNYMLKKFKHYAEVRRGDAEINKAWKQPIPYAVIKRGDEVFVYKRLSGGGETRLHDQLSIGIGGHMNRINNIYDWKDNLLLNFYRELHEELDIMDPIPEPEIIGLINDDNDEAGEYHIGILMVVTLPEHVEVSVRETDKLEGYWLRSKDLWKHPLFESLEAWSKLAVEVL